MVAEILRRSLAEHERAKLLRRTDKEQARSVLTAARDLRLQALGEDPDRKDPAWAAGVPHDEMMRFYAEQLD